MYAELKVEFDSNEINFQQSSNLQGVLMENISSEYAEKLHGNQLNPYLIEKCSSPTGDRNIYPFIRAQNNKLY